MKHERIDVPTILDDEAELPHYASHGASGADVRAFIKEEVVIAAGSSILIPTGLRFAIPEGYEIQVRPRSGLALKNQITVLNSPGTIDADYRGELSVIMINHGKENFIVKPGMRIAQIVLAPVFQANFCISDELATTARGVGAFGHTGIQ